MTRLLNSRQPIYCIMVMEKSGAETLKYESGKDSGFPDVGETDYPGFYYDVNEAIDTMHNNTCDIREGIYNYGLVLKHYPGMYGNTAGSASRIYFKWDPDRDGYFETEEPPLLELLAF